ncbi:MAG: hypothetical protein HUU22_15580 [Phycisphaerae bacterium]|nr:hypothetical protein [Phycisphaerae bacterium]
MLIGDTVADLENLESLGVCRLVASLPPIPPANNDEDIDFNRWTHVIAIARVIQRLEPGEVEYALNRFCIHAETAYEREADGVYEWSKVYLLNRVLFNFNDRLPPPADGPATFSTGFTLTHIRGQPSCEDLECPIVWNEGRPELGARLLAFNGGPYRGGDEFAFLRRRFGFRKLHL